MRFAIINGERVEAAPQLIGFCPGCNLPVIARCGTQRIHHWAHRNNLSCDSWWEPETEWHRLWKSNFPDEWQEIILRDEMTGERHIADIRTGHGLVIEFQHSHITPQERISRESFYKNMVWLVDGTRLKREHQRFLSDKDYFFQMSYGSFLVGSPQRSLPTAWLSSPIPVIFDYRSNKSGYGSADVENYVYCLFPVRIGTSALLEKISIKAFVDDAINGASTLRIRSFMRDKNQFVRELQHQITMLQKFQARSASANFSRPATYKKRGRF